MSSSVELGSGFGRFLAAKIEFSYGAVQTVNLLALRIQWFESTPTQASPRAILQVMAQLAPAGINIIIKPQNQTHLPAAMFHRSLLLWICPASAASFFRS